MDDEDKFKISIDGDHDKEAIVNIPWHVDFMRQKAVRANDFQMIETDDDDEVPILVFIMCRDDQHGIGTFSAFTMDTAELLANQILEYVAKHKRVN